ncbi:MAG: AzlC family ABC transporter permease [Bacillus sp. (in: firmicutes)]
MSSSTMFGSNRDFRKGILAGTSIAIGYAPVALTFGLLAKSAGLSFLMAVLMSLLVYAGAAQYMSLNLIGLGTGMFEIILTTCIVNIRHFLMSAALEEKVGEEKTGIKAIYAFGVTDETFSVVATTKGTPTTGYIMGVFSLAYFSWVFFTAAGYAFGAALPDPLQQSMSIALYAMFIGLLVPAVKGSMKALFLAMIAAAFSSIFTVNGILPAGWAIVAATLLSSILIETVFHFKKKTGVG